MVKMIKKIEEYKEGIENLIKWEQLPEKIKTGGLTTKALFNNGYIIQYHDIENDIFFRQPLYCKFEINALMKCDFGKLMGYKGMQEHISEHRYFELIVKEEKGEL
jgi:hypothetical protein